MRSRSLPSPPLPLAGMPIESLSRMLGHTNITTTQIYAKITMHKLEEDMDRLAERLNI
jgi:site-specific recombinase XerD